MTKRLSQNRDINPVPKTHDSRLYKPELIAPAGDWERLHSAIVGGADSVYFGVKGLNMRNAANNFDLMELKKIMKILKDNGMKGYLALNVIVYDREVELVKKILESAKKAGVDAVVCWDMAVMQIAIEKGLKVHLSTQASVSNFESLKYYASLGVERIVLARECTLSDIKKIIKKAEKEGIKCSVEAFIHGAMCVSVSGRCFMSQHTFGKSANRGECIQPCRREFKIECIDEEAEYIIGNDHVLSPKDLCSIMFIDKLIDAGISAFKIEGRMRASEYIKIVTGVYREAIDKYYEGKLSSELKEELYVELKNMYNRGLSPGFFLGDPEEWISSRLENEYEKIYLGEVSKFYKKISVAEIELRANGLKTGDEILIYGKSTPASFMKINEIEIEHKTVKKASKGTKVAVKVPFIAKPKDKVFIWCKRA